MCSAKTATAKTHEPVLSKIINHEALLCTPNTNMGSPLGILYRRQFYEVKGNNASDDFLQTSNAYRYLLVEDTATILPLAKRMKQNVFSSLDYPYYFSENINNNMDIRHSVISNITHILRQSFSILEDVTSIPKIETLVKLSRKTSYLERLKVISQLLNLFENTLNRSDLSISQAAIKDFETLKLSYSILNLYSILWYSTSVNDDNQVENSTQNYSDMFLDGPNEMSSKFKHIISKSKIALLLWYIKHEYHSTPKFSLNHVLRSLELFDFNCIETDVPPQVFDEISNHIAKLALLCNFSELFQLLHIFKSKEDRLANILTTALLSPHIVRSISAYRINLLNPKTHSTFLATMGNAIKLALAEDDIDINSYLKKSVFAKAAGILSGNEAFVDFAIYKIFPESWISSFVIGLFWRNIEQSQIISELTHVAGNVFDEIGDFTAFFFASWLESHPRYEKLVIPNYEKPIAYLLSNNIEELVNWFVLHSNLPISPVMMELLHFDHYFDKEELKTAKVIFEFIKSLPDNMEELASFYYALCLKEAVRESINRKFLTKMKHLDKLGTKFKQKFKALEKLNTQRRPRYEYIDNAKGLINDEQSSLRADKVLSDMEKIKVFHPIIGQFKELSTSIESNLFSLLSRIRVIRNYESYDMLVSIFDFLIVHEPIVKVIEYTKCLLKISQTISLELKKKALQSADAVLAENAILLSCSFEFLTATNITLNSIQDSFEEQEVSVSDYLNSCDTELTLFNWRFYIALQLENTENCSFAKSTFNDLLDIIVYKDPKLKQDFRIPELFLQYIDKQNQNLILIDELLELTKLTKFIPIMQKGLSEFESYSFWQTSEKEQFVEVANWIICQLCLAKNVIPTCYIGKLFDVIHKCIQIPNFFASEVLIKFSEFWAQYDHQMFPWAHNAPDPWNPFTAKGKEVRDEFNKTLSKANLRQNITALYYAAA